MMKRKIEAKFYADVPDEKGRKSRIKGSIKIFTEHREDAWIKDDVRNAVREERNLRAVAIEVEDYRDAA